MSNFKSNGPDDVVDDGRRWPEQLDSIVEEFSSCFDSMKWGFFSNTQRGTLLLCPSKNGTIETRYMVANHVHMSHATLTTRSNSS